MARKLRKESFYISNIRREALALCKKQKLPMDLALYIVSRSKGHLTWRIVKVKDKVWKDAVESLYFKGVMPTPFELKTSFRDQYLREVRFRRVSSSMDKKLKNNLLESNYKIKRESLVVIHDEVESLDLSAISSHSKMVAERLNAKIERSIFGSFPKVALVKGSLTKEKLKEAILKSRGVF